MFTKILVALDYGDTCNELFQKSLKLAQSTGAELLFLSVLTPDSMGNFSHGRKGLGEMLLGSVSNYVMRHAPCSVMVIHEPAAINDNGRFTEEAMVEQL